MAFTSLEKILCAFWVFVAIIQISKGCSPIPGDDEEDKIEKKFYYSDHVVYGKVLAHFEDEKPMYDTVYTALMEVYCTFKGKPLPQRINVSDAGFVPGLCHSTNLTIGTEFTVFLDSNNGKYTPTYKEDQVNDQYLEEISLICEHDINYPIGLDENKAEMTCPENYPDYEGCLSYTEPSLPPPNKSGDEIHVKSLAEDPAVAPANNDDKAKPSVKDNGDNGNGSDVLKTSYILLLGLLLHKLAL